MRRLILAASLASVSVAAVAGTPEVIQVSSDTYMVVVKNRAGIFGNPQTTKMNAIKAANAFAEKQGKSAVPVAMEYTPAGGPGHWPAAEYQFRLAEKGDQASGGALIPRADITVDLNQTSPAPANPQSTRPDLYTELLKLDDLRKRGLLTDAEFESAKARLLAR